MSELRRYTKHPDAIRAYPINVVHLGTNTIGALSAVSIPTGLTIVSVTSVGDQVIALIGGGTDGVLYQVEVSIGISDGQVLIREFEIDVIDN